MSNNCKHCGRAFEAVRVTAQYCQDKCRVLAYQKRQRDAARVERERLAKNVRQALTRRLRTAWQKTVATDGEYQQRLMHAVMDVEEGHGSQDKIDQIKDERERAKRRTAGIRANIEREAESNKIDIGLIRGD